MQCLSICYCRTGSKRYVDSCGKPYGFDWKYCVWENDPIKSSKEAESNRLPEAKKV